MYQKCCFRINLRIGILLWSYFLQIWNIVWLVLQSINMNRSDDVHTLTQWRVLAIALLVISFIFGILAFAVFIVNPNKLSSIILMIIFILYSTGYLIWGYIILWTFVPVMYSLVLRLLSIMFLVVLIAGTLKNRKKLVQLWFNYSIISTAFNACILLVDFIYFFYIFTIVHIEEEAQRTFFKVFYITMFAIKALMVFVEVFFQLYMMEKIKEYLEQLNNDGAGNTYRAQAHNPALQF